MAEVDSVRVFRGIYSGFALAMSEVEAGIQFDQLPSSDEIANTAYELCREIITRDPRQRVPGAQQEFTSMAVALAVLEHGGVTDGLSWRSVSDSLDGLWRLIGRAWQPRQVTDQVEASGH
jgi:hypothetical protein